MHSCFPTLEAVYMSLLMFLCSYIDAEYIVEVFPLGFKFKITRIVRGVAHGRAQKRDNNLLWRNK